MYLTRSWEHVKLGASIHQKIVNTAMGTLLVIYVMIYMINFPSPIVYDDRVREKKVVLCICGNVDTLLSKFILK